jgi:zinc-ribbon family
MIIFGWGHQTAKNFGPTFKNHCSHCNNEEYWVLTRIMTWFTLFFIPVFPYSIKYFLSCPICQYGVTLDTKQSEQIKPIAEANQLLIDGKITEAEYKIQINRLGSGASAQVWVEAVEQKVLSSGNEDVGFCAECGMKVTKAITFCGNCGKVAQK